MNEVRNGEQKEVKKYLYSGIFYGGQKLHKYFSFLVIKDAPLLTCSYRTGELRNNGSCCISSQVSGCCYYYFYCTMCVCYTLCCHPLYSGRQVCGRTSHTGGRSQNISHPPSFCGGCLNFSFEKDSAVPFPRRAGSRLFVYITN